MHDVLNWALLVFVLATTGGTGALLRRVSF